MVYTNNWKIETDYTTRPQLIYFDQVYGTLTLGPMQVTNHIGINNAFVTDTLAGVVAAIAGTAASYAS